MKRLEILCVLKSEGEYKSEHVERLHRQVLKHLPDARFRCISDVDVPCERVPMEHPWPRWWSKQNLFSPAITGDFLYLDLDSAIVGDLSDLAGLNRLAIMRDVYRKDGLQSSIMFLPEADRAKVWAEWVKSPEVWMQMYRKGGDQAFLERLWLGKAAIIQDELPGQVVSYKAHVRPAVRKDREFGNGTVPDGARVIAFHGRPRPWDVGW